ncbi:MAG TPA: cyclodeaminase/cyclohydrolase family protein [Thermomicrobiales bacterium]|nr:cyclodeaminase/cyclohydrolase family protein [Thermomicrobiales bacterium]
MSEKNETIENRRIGEYLDALTSSAPAPGGGSVAGLTGALAAGLGEMVVSLTRDPDPSVIEAGARLADLRASALTSGAADELAYGGYVRASKMPKSTDEEKARRLATMQEALQEAAVVPLELARTSMLILEQLDPIIRHGNKYVISDGAAAISLCLSCIDICMINANANLPRIKNAQVAESLRKTAHDTEQRARTLADQLRALYAERA